MDSANQGPAAHPLRVLLAGLQAGVIGICGALLWLGVNAVWQRRSFWTAANLMASTFYGDRAIHSGFARITLAGLALYIVVYGVLGAVFAGAASGRARGLRLVLIGMLFGIAWYFLSFGFMWKKISPLMVLLHFERPTLVGHLLYGGIVGRFESFLGPGE
jgi:hypothetical protein